MLKVKCECPKCQMVGWRYADGFATQDDPTFECRYCKYRGGQEITARDIWIFVIFAIILLISVIIIANLILGGRI